MVGNSSQEFFKVYLSQISSKQLGLPPAFISNLGGKIPRNCTIKDFDGKIWKVKLEEVRTGLVFANGWEEFVNHHSLVDGEFLVFDYDGDSQFVVKICGMNGLQKRKALDACASTSSVKKGKQQGVEEMSNSLPLRPNVVYERRNSEVHRKRTSTCPGRHDHPADFVPPKAEEAIITSSYPYFKALMCSGHLGSNTFVPSKFVMNHIKPQKEHAKQRVKVIETQLLMGDNKWSVRLNVYFNHRGRGKLLVEWRKFVRDNGLEVVMNASLSWSTMIQ